MEINKNSWHFKILTAKPFDPETLPRSLCSYFWAVVFAFWTRVAIGAVVGAIIFIFTVFPAYGVAILIKTEYFSIDHFLALFSLLGIIGAMSILIGVFKVKEKYDRLYSSHPLKSAVRESLILQFLKSKKDKVCPTINYIDSKENKI